MLNRIIFEDDTTLNDFSVNLNKYQSGTNSFSYVTADDAFYIGMAIPFNHLFFKLGATVNLLSSGVTVQYWNGTDWKNAVDVIDETSLSGASLGQSGFLQWSTNFSDSWQRESTSENGQARIPDLGSLVIFDLYWVKLTWDASMTASVDLSWVGQKFSDDEDLGSEYPDFLRSNFLTAWESGKTDWEEQHVRTGILIAQDLIKKGIIKHKGQILDRYKLIQASVSKTAELIYAGLGKNYVEDKLDARKEYELRLDLDIFNVDQDFDGKIDLVERDQRQGFLKR